jgi:peptidoglycan/LPS O-acetylase OafA/YrhL
MYYLHGRHGNIFVGRIIVAAAFLLVLAVNWLIFKQAGIPEHPNPWLKMAAIISLIWMFAGGWGMYIRMGWGRAWVLTILYVGSLGFLIAVISLLVMGEHDWLMVLSIGTAVYSLASLVLTNSKHVKRLTKR